MRGFKGRKLDSVSLLSGSSVYLKELITANSGTDDVILQILDEQLQGELDIAKTFY